MSDSEFKRLGISSDTISFDELCDVLYRDITIKAAEKSIQMAEKYGLSKMTLEEINTEVAAVRQNAKRNH